MALGSTSKTGTSSKTTPSRKSPRAPAKSLAKAPARKAAMKTDDKPTAAPIPKVVKLSEPVVARTDLKKKDLIDEVVTRAGVKKKDAKPIIEAVLEVLGDTLADGQELNLQPLGKLRINRSEDHGNYRIIVCKLRQQIGAPKAAEDPLAEAAE